MNRLLIPLLAMLITFQFAALYAENKPGSVIPGRLMVQLNDMEQLSAITENHKSINLRLERILSKRLNIALLSFDASKMAGDVLLGQMRSMPGIVNAQHEHIVQLREAHDEQIPDDPNFDLQWAFHNTGQSGGTPGADIDALRAWDITTGGLTALGDTIVVAVIDGGCDINHEDLSIFRNWNEIPGNGIDDDGNGYIDDVNGWNAYNNTGNVPLSNHGTHVSGTVGAVGNNETGVTGVNWNVKVLPIAGSSSNESTVVAAYAYAYDMRALYDETDGEYGAFVVATNSSFGVDFGQPENFPIWGAMYDSMGTLGILSAAATANRNINIDEVGDMPTAHPSPYLISVTNTTNNDVKLATAGYGVETIDLGAPGTQIYSTRNNSTYGFATGTSMATPHVAGAIALLMSAADADFITYYKQNPSEAALQLKQYLLDGTDQLASLDGLVASGGRLNLYNSIQLLAGDFPELSIQPQLMSASLFPDQDTTAVFYIKNTGADTAYASLYLKDTLNWFGFSPDSITLAEGDSIGIQYNISSAGLTPGSYEAILLIDALHGQQLEFLAQLQVLNPPPFLELSTQLIEMPLIMESDTTTSFDMWNSGGDSLFFSIYLTEQADWIGFDVDTGYLLPGDSINIKLGFRSFGLEPDHYQAQLNMLTAHGQEEMLMVELQVYSTESVAELQAAGLQVAVVPNPFRGNAVFSIRNAFEAPIHLRILDMNGTVLRETTLEASDPSATRQWQWNGTDAQGNACSNGIYLYSVEVEGMIQTGKIVLQR